jgi:hypothetical protein
MIKIFVIKHKRSVKAEIELGLCENERGEILLLREEEEKERVSQVLSLIPQLSLSVSPGSWAG